MGTSGAVETGWSLEMLEATPVPTFVIDHGHRVIHWNRACETITGVSAAAIVGTRDQWRAFYPLPRPVMADLILDGGDPAQVRLHYGDKCRPSPLIDGAWEAEDYFAGFPVGPRWLFFTAAPLRDAAGRLVGVVETLQDVTQRRNAELALQLYEQAASPTELEIVRDINRRIAQASSIVQLVDFVFTRIAPCLPCDRIGVAFVEENGRRLTAYHTVARYEPIWLKKGFSQDLAGSSLEAVIRDGRPRILNDLAEYAARHPQSQSTALILREGIRSSLTCPLIVDGRPIGVLFFSARRPNAYSERHVSLHLAIAERLSQAAEKAYRIEQLETVNRAYQDVLGFVAHELKSPVAAMVTNADLFLDGYLGEITETQRDKLRRIADKGRYLIGFVETYLNLSRVEEAEKAPVLIDIPSLAAQVVEPAIDLTREAAAQRGMVLEAELPAEPLAIQGDAELLRILTANLIGNAVKYGRPGGRIHVALRTENGCVIVSVWNEGQGIPPETRHSLFQRFSRQETRHAIRQKGTGLGLYICWKIVQMHGGRIWAESEPGAWACFTFRLPRQPPVGEAPPLPPPTGRGDP